MKKMMDSSDGSDLVKERGKKVLQESFSKSVKFLTVTLPYLYIVFWYKDREFY